MTQQKTITANEFTQPEINEIHQFVDSNIQYAQLEGLFTYTDVPLPKARVYTAVFRVIQAARDVVKADETRNKLNSLLSENEEIYRQVLPLVVYCMDPKVNFGLHRKKRQLEELMIDPKNIESINKLINIFLILVEKNQLISLDKTVALDLETDEGKKALKDLGIKYED